MNDFIASIFRHVFDLHRNGKAADVRHYGADTKKPETMDKASSGFSRFVTEKLIGKRGKEVEHFFYIWLCLFEQKDFL